MNKVLILLIFCVFGQFAAHAKSNAMPKNTVGINTIHIANNHIGIGAFYERAITENGRLSVIVPVSVGWEYYAISTITQTSNNSFASYFANPGFKFYPFGNRKFFSYALGLSAFSQMGKVSRMSGNASAFPISGQYNEYKFTTAGLLINNYLNFKLNKNLSFGFEIGIGPSIYNNYKPANEETVVKGGTLIYQNIAFQVAYQF